MIEVRILEQEEQEEAETFLKREFSSFSGFDFSCDEHVFSIGAYENDTLVGHILVHEGYQYLKNKKFYTLDYVLVDSLYRRMGICSSMLNLVFRIAEDKGIDYITLTSKPSREEARKLYRDFGFSLKETGVFTKYLKEE